MNALYSGGLQNATGGTFTTLNAFGRIKLPDIFSGYRPGSQPNPYNPQARTNTQADAGVQEFPSLYFLLLILLFLVLLQNFLQLQALLLFHYTLLISFLLFSHLKVFSNRATFKDQK